MMARTCQARPPIVVEYKWNGREGSSSFEHETDAQDWADWLSTCRTVTDIRVVIEP